LQELVPIAEEDATWNLLLYLIKNHLAGTPVAISTLASVAKAPHATAMRRIHALIERGDILQEPLADGSKRFKLRPSEALLESFIQYARKIKFLLAETFGLRSKTDSEEDFYFGGSCFAVSARSNSCSMTTITSFLCATCGLTSATT
jgi:multiple sugar transport system substrate-binding protein